MGIKDQFWYSSKIKLAYNLYLFLMSLTSRVDLVSCSVSFMEDHKNVLKIKRLCF